ncbi:MAG: ABC transporter ATP-binding protein [Ruminococcaceae bacterium]|nr:ABC transporter ATP-binding protein [Oscillospiraceae bacterium]
MGGRGGFAPTDNGKAPETETKKDYKGLFKRLSGYVMREWHLFFLAILLTFLSNQLALLGPLYSGSAIDAIVAEGGVDFPTVWDNIFKMLSCYVLSAVLSYLLALLMVKLSQRIIRTMRKELFTKISKLPIPFFDKNAVGDIVSRMSYDIDTINSSLSHDLVQVMTSLYTVIGSAIFMLRISKPMMLIFVVTVPITIFFTRYRTRKVRPMFRERSKRLGELNGYAEEMLSGQHTIRTYGREKTISESFNGHNAEAMQATYRAEYFGGTLGPSVNFINNLSIVLVTVLGGILYMYSQSGAIMAGTAFFITLGGVAQFVQYSRKFAGPINEFANILHEFQSAFSAAERVFRVLDEPIETPDAEDAVTLEKVRGEVEFEHVTFSYIPEKPVLKDFTLHVKAGQTVAIVGPTGAGKTTVINLLMRFYDPVSGEIRIDGHPLKDITRESLRRAFTMVLQDTWLFYGSVYDNIVYGKENATREEVKKAARRARIDSFIEGLPDGYDTLITDDGVNISKGQKQLITIARAMLSDAPMLILDEATSNVDSRTEKKIAAAMDALMRERTCFVVAHRLSTIENADLILVLRDGTITESGTHGELLSLGGFYASLYNSQFK